MSFRKYKQYMGAFRFYCISIALLALSAYIGVQWGNESIEKQQAEIAGLKQSLVDLNKENHEIIKRLNILGVELEVERMASQESQGKVVDSMQQFAELKKELSFYQKVMAPELEEDGFTIDSLNIGATNSANFYRLSLVLMQQDKLKKHVKGSVGIKLKGSLNGKPHELDLVSMMTEGQNSIKFSFKYFEVIEGEFTLPKGFTPEQLLVNSTVNKAKNKRANLQRTFDWSLYSGEKEQSNS